MMESCSVSVITITFNQVNYISEALDSLLSQKTNFRYEIIIHDDASTDGTVEILKEYKKKYPDIIRLILEKQNQWSKDIDFFAPLVKDVARGEYVAICEGDDYWTDDHKLQLQFDAMESHPECDMCACGARMVSADGKLILGEIRPKNKDGFLVTEEVIAGGGNYVATAGLFFRRSMFDHMMDFEKIRSLDYSHQIKGSLRGGIFYLDKIMAAYRRYSTSSVTRTITGNGAAMNIQCEQEKEILRTLDFETNGKYHDVIVRRIEDYNISCFEQLMTNKEIIIKEIGNINCNIFIWGMGVRGKELERFCKEAGITICGVCDILNKNIGETTVNGNGIVKSEDVLEKADVILASVTGAYDYLKTAFAGKVLNMQKYMPRI